LRADSEASVRRTALKLEDALRCASLPDVGERLLLVRHLDLGRIAAHASSHTVSLLLEARVAAIGGTWVHGAASGAEQADFVFFSDTLEARHELSLRLCGSASCAAWFWPLAVPEFEPAEDARSNVRSIAFAIAALPEAPAALPAWIAGLAASGLAPVLARMIAPADGVMLLRAAHLTVHAPGTAEVPTDRIQLSRLAHGAMKAGDVESPQREKADPGLAALPEWLRILADAGGVASGVLPSALAEHGPRVRRVTAPDQKEIEPTHLTPPAGRSVPESVGLEANTKGAQDTPVSVRRNEDRVPAADRADGVVSEEQPMLPSSRRVFPDTVCTAHGGLLFLLPVLQRLEYATWADALPEGEGAEVARQMLALALRRLRAPLDDPAWTLAAVIGGEETRYDEIQAPSSWSDATLKAPGGCKANELTLLVKQTRSTTTFAHLWLVACRRWLRRAAGIGVASLVRRPATIGLTSTHAGMYFRLSDADIRIRRVGLDCDPGWMSWFGRVVSFHYRDESL
jgi:hypothetical protein